MTTEKCRKSILVFRFVITRRQAEDIKTLETGLNRQMGGETMWKVIGLVLTLGGAGAASLGS